MSSAINLFITINHYCPVDGRITMSLVLKRHQSWRGLQCCKHGPSSAHIQPGTENVLVKLRFGQWLNHLFEVFPGKTLRGT